MKWMRISTLILITVLTICPLSGCGAPQAVEPQATPELSALALAEQYEAAGETENAIAAYQNTYETDPRQADVLRKLIALCTQETETGRTDHSEKLIGFYNDLYAMEQITDEELLKLCDLYQARGETGRLCILLERAQRLSPADEWESRLDTLIVDAAKASDAEQQAITPLWDALSKLDTDAAVDLLLDGTAWEPLRSTVRGGVRRYVYKGDGGELKIETSFDAAAAPLLRVWYLGNSGDAAVIRLEDRVLSVTNAKQSGGAYSGPFTSAYYEAGTGSIFVDAGTFSGNVLTGDFTTEACFGTSEIPLLTLWNERANMEKILYEGTFDETGHTTEKQPSNVRRKGVAYAYQDGSSSKYIYVLDSVIEGNKEKEYVFDSSDIGVDLPPVW